MPSIRVTIKDIISGVSQLLFTPEPLLTPRQFIDVITIDECVETGARPIISSYQMIGRLADRRTKGARATYT